MACFRLVVASVAAAVAFIITLPVLVLAFPIWCVSILTRGISRLFEPPFLMHEQLIEFDPTFGWKARPSLDTHHFMGDIFRIKTDPHGWRGKTTLSESEIVVIGDSFAAGYGVGERHFFANLRGGPKIKAIGVGGYSMVQELLLLEQLAPELRDKFVVWFVYYGNDLYDNLSPDLRGYRKPFVRESSTGSWEITSAHVGRAQWPVVTRVRLEGQHHLSKLSEICSDTYLAARAYGACTYLIRSAERICRDAGARLAIMTIPETSQLTEAGQSALKARAGNAQSFDPHVPDKRLETICQEVGIPFCAGRSFLDANCYMHNDCHWNTRGHRNVAKALAKLYASFGGREKSTGSHSAVPAGSSLTAVKSLC
jgi:hypothetical protein